MQLHWQRSRAAYESARLAVNASGANFEAARASYQAAIANREMAEKDAGRLEKLYQEDPGAISVRRLEIAQSTRDEARSKAQRAEADMRQAQEAAGEQNESNAALLSAKGAVEKAETRSGQHQGDFAGARSRHRPARRRRSLRTSRRAA